MDKPVVRDAALLLLRLVLGVVFIAHGWQIFLVTGLTETTGQFSAWGVPQPGLSVWIVGIAELLGGAMLVIGFLTTIVAGGFLLLITAALYFLAADFSYHAVLIVSLLMIVVFGSGRASVDRLLVR
ncbi:DoxX family protein [Corynebacterium caspium]|uniref:DoxX family protein n=1 Tax=Corynebacterium caspium TaxID=234828 RepID=UPI00038052BD|nr:DoxX family protein [Corynebacterium caspium]WKD59610.1 DoxX [Corynebacterium caspium DSM 44850]